ncbi:GGDEF domain-containing protein [Egibacter rhizosphaerae]|uniref:GGDEF domain-containing protein n=1 Tax=Egibacter rhizosphaerae TaxID=1670831 RepID=A0A411YFM4_9ACTN|nr:diguanylate cyclase [Egibacter rhizosphaerae]QBI19971.1 GGDEF domain-containing protein [Egibacter rhizosphaerae]
MEHAGERRLVDLLAGELRAHVAPPADGLRRRDAACVWGDNAAGMRPLLAHLLDERDARRPALVRGIPHHPDSIARERHYRDGLARRGMPVDEDLVITGWFTPEPTYTAMWELLERRRDFDAVVALNDMSAVSAIAALNDAGLRVPEDVAVTGYDNDLIATQWPGLTTVDQSFGEQGRVAAELMLEQIRDGPIAREVAVTSRVVVRGSTRPKGEPPVTDLDEAIAIAKSDKEQLAARDASLALSSALNYCWTVDEIVDAVSAHLHRLGIIRCYLGLYERRFDPDGDDGPTRVETDRARVVLAYRNGERHGAPTEPIASHELLPPDLADELEGGMLVLQPLAVLDRPLGYLLFEQSTGSARVAALMRTELSRAIDGVFTGEELLQHARYLEQVVERRTRELQAEVVTRRRAERELQRAVGELQRSAMRDGLTQLANRTAFAEHLDEQWREHLETGRELAVLMVDVDAFKPYNDHYGHLAGDEALRVVAECLARAIAGPDDLACRYGGEEFTAVLANTATRGARAVCERFRRYLDEAAVPHATSPIGGRLTPSVGVAAGAPHASVDPSHLVDLADQALYDAKAAGRDRVATRRMDARPSPVDAQAGPPDPDDAVPVGPAAVGRPAAGPQEA